MFLRCRMSVCLSLVLITGIAASGTPGVAAPIAPPSGPPEVVVYTGETTTDMTAPPVYSTEAFAYSQRGEATSIDAAVESVRLELKVGSTVQPGDLLSGFVRKPRFDLADAAGKPQKNRFSIFLRVSMPAHVYVVDFGTSGKISSIYPHAEGTAPLSPDAPLFLDGTRKEQWTVQGPTGVEWVLAIASSKDIGDAIRQYVSANAGAGQQLDQLKRMQDLRNHLGAHCAAGKIDLAFSSQQIAIMNNPAEPAPVVGGTVGQPLPWGGPGTPPGPPSTPGATVPRSIGLCIGINRYRGSQNGDFPDLTCAVNDARSIRDKLVSSLSLAAEDIRLITDDKATLEGIRTELKWLKDNARGKRVYLHYSGHGVPAQDPHGDRSVMHSAIVPHDFDMPAYLDGRGGNLLYDTEVGKWIDSLDCENLVMLFDACHSGAITRSLQKGSLTARGFSIPSLTRSAVISGGRLQIAINTDKRNAFIMLACQFDQRAFEDKATGHGLLTSYILENMERLAVGRALFESAKDHIQKRAAEESQVQIPVLVDNTGKSDFSPFGR